MCAGALLAAGLAPRIVTQLLQGQLPGALNWLANETSGSPLPADVGRCLARLGEHRIAA